MFKLDKKENTNKLACKKNTREMCYCSGIFKNIKLSHTIMHAKMLPWKLP